MGRKNPDDSQQRRTVTHMQQRRTGTARKAAVLTALALFVAACTSSSGAHRSAASSAPSSAAPTSTSTSAAPATSSSAAATPAAGSAPAHVVIVLEENHSAAEVLGNPQAPYMNRLAGEGDNLTDFRAITHPSQPNYVALFSGSTHGLASDSCPHSFAGPNLGSELRAAHRSFVGYAEDLPHAGSLACTAGAYARKHAPWTNFRDLPSSSNQPLTAWPADFARLPTLSFVIPNLDHDMHDGTVRQADRWLQQHLSSYVSWARQHDSLLIVTWDEDDRSEGNRIPTFAVGQGVRHGRDRTPADLYSLSRTIEAWYHLPALGQTARHDAIASLSNGG
jgi:acid phosphatase